MAYHMQLGSLSTHSTGTDVPDLPPDGLVAVVDLTHVQTRLSATTRDYLYLVPGMYVRDRC